MRSAERWTEHTKRLPPLTVGDNVRIQNQTGPQPTKWEKTGLVIEVRHRIAINTSYGWMVLAESHCATANSLENTFPCNNNNLVER